MTGRRDSPDSGLPAGLKKSLDGLGRVALALSGGLDSRFLALAMRLGGLDFVAIHASGPHVPGEESRQAHDFARRLGIDFLELAFNPLDYADVAANGRMRCYHCKREMIRLLKRTAPGRLVCDGTNADDLGRHRPGLAALREAGARSPLADAGLGKKRIRELGRRLGLERPDQRARPCLLTRFAYGLPASGKSLRMLAEAEKALAGLEGMGLGLGDFRIRLLPRPCLQAENLDRERRAMALEILRRSGFADPALMPCSPSGYFDRAPESVLA